MSLKPAQSHGKIKTFINYFGLTNNNMHKLWKLLGAWGAIALLPLICGVSSPQPEVLCPQLPNLIPVDGDCEQFCSKQQLDGLIRTICDENSWSYFTEAELEDALEMSLNEGDVPILNAVSCLLTGGKYISGDPLVYSFIDNPSNWLDGVTLWDYHYGDRNFLPGSTICYAEYLYSYDLGNKTVLDRELDMLDLNTSKFYPNNLLLHCCDSASDPGCSNYDEYFDKIMAIDAELPGNVYGYCEDAMPCYAEISNTLFGVRQSYDWDQDLYQGCLNLCETIRDEYNYSFDGTTLQGCEENSVCWLTAYVDFMSGTQMGDIDVNSECIPIEIVYDDPGQPGLQTGFINNYICETFKQCSLIQEILATQ